MKSFTTISILAALGANVDAHGIVTKIIVGGTKTYQGYDPSFQYMPTPPAGVIGWTAPATQDRGPVAGNALNTDDIICAKGATNAKAAANVVAGETVSLQWTPWPTSHHGPVLDYLASCGSDDCSTVDKTTLKFFKIDGVGMTSTSGSPPNFADDDMIANNNTWSVKIPTGIAPGSYVLRHETIALHQANQQGGSQPYPQCINIKVSGSGTDQPAGVLGTQLYKETDPGILFNIYTTFTNTNQYPVPGPTLYAGAASGGATNNNAGGSASPTTAAAGAATTAKAAASSKTASPSSGTGCKVKRWHAKDFAV